VLLAAGGRQGAGLNSQEIGDLQSWAAQPRRKPLIIIGVRQVGKSVLVRRLALVEINFDRNPELREAFASKEPADILTILQLPTEQSVIAGKTFLFLDEI
jgi:uncharacterized protein